jgi:hypothetical protein
MPYAAITPMQQDGSRALRDAPYRSQSTPIEGDKVFVRKCSELEEA